MIASVFIPHGGCPERCTFCDQSVSGGEAVRLVEIENSIEEQLSTSAGHDNEIAFYGGTFTALRKELQIKYLEVAKKFLSLNKAHSIRISTRPDAIDKEWIENLHTNYNVNVIELGVQSFDPAVLKRLGRSHTIESVFNAVQIIKDAKIKVSIHVMIGCPEETEQSRSLTLGALLGLKPDYVRIHPLLVLKGTALEREYEAHAFVPLTLEDTVDIAADWTLTLENEQIEVIRLGLQANELLETSIVAGAYDEAFGHRVRARIVRKKLHNILNNNKLDKIIELEVHPKKESQLKGQNKENLTWIKETFQLTHQPKVVVSKDLNESQIGIRYIIGPTERRQIYTL